MGAALRVPREKVRDLYALDGKVHAEIVGLFGGEGTTRIVLLDEDVRAMARRCAGDAARAAVVLRGLPEIRLSNFQQRDRRSERFWRRDLMRATGGRYTATLDLKTDDDLDAAVLYDALDRLNAAHPSWVTDAKDAGQKKVEVIVSDYFGSGDKADPETKEMRSVFRRRKDLIEAFEKALAEAMGVAEPTVTVAKLNIATAKPG